MGSRDLGEVGICQNFGWWRESLPVPLPLGVSLLYVVLFYILSLKKRHVPNKKRHLPNKMKTKRKTVEIAKTLPLRERFIPVGISENARVSS